MKRRLTWTAVFEVDDDDPFYVLATASQSYNAGNCFIEFGALSLMIDVERDATEILAAAS